MEEKVGLKFDTKLIPRHIDFKNETMCVRLALQVLSKSVSEALICCEREMKLPQFQGASATAEFCAYFNDPLMPLIFGESGAEF